MSFTRARASHGVTVKYRPVVGTPEVFVSFFFFFRGVRRLNISVGRESIRSRQSGILNQLRSIEVLGSRLNQDNQEIISVYNAVSGRDVRNVSSGAKVFMRAGLYAGGGAAEGRKKSERFRVDTHTRHVAHYRTFIQRIVPLRVRFRCDTRYLHNT